MTSPTPVLQLILAAENSRKRYKLQGEMCVGREASCHIILQSVNISRLHAKITLTEQGAQLEDLNSANGTYVNGLKVQGTTPIHLGDLICFDDQPFRIIAEDIPETLIPHLRTLTAEQLAIQSPVETPTEDAPSNHTRALSFHEMKHILKQSEALSLATQPAHTAAELHFFNGDTLTKVLPLQALALDTRWKLGKDLSSKICLRDPALLQDHGYLARNESGYRLTLTSQAPAFSLNGKKLRDAYLQQGDNIQIGDCRLVFYTKPSSTPAALQNPAVTPRPSHPSDNFSAPWPAIITALFILGVLGAVYFLQP